MTIVVHTQQPSVVLPSKPLHYGFFTLTFASNETFALEGQGWPTFKGTWKLAVDELTLLTPGMQECNGPGRYRAKLDGPRLLLTLIDDGCEPRRMIVHDSAWLPEGEHPAIARRDIVRTAVDPLPNLPTA